MGECKEYKYIEGFYKQRNCYGFNQNNITQCYMNQSQNCFCDLNNLSSNFVHGSISRGPVGLRGSQGPVGPIGPQGIQGEQGPIVETGPQGLPEGVLNYADFYALMPPDNAATVAPGTSAIIGTALVETILEDSILIVRNPASNAEALIITP